MFPMLRLDLGQFFHGPLPASWFALTDSDALRLGDQNGGTRFKTLTLSVLFHDLVGIAVRRQIELQDASPGVRNGDSTTFLFHIRRVLKSVRDTVGQPDSNNPVSVIELSFKKYAPVVQDRQAACVSSVVRGLAW